MEGILSKAADRIRKADFVRVVCQYDADGISAGAIALKMLLREGKIVHLSVVKQIKPGIVEELKKEDNKLILFVDVGAGYLDLLSQLNSDIIIADHHQPMGSGSERIIHINPRLHDIGEKEMSGAGVTYQLAKTLNPDNKDLSCLVVIGAIGDIQEDKWTMSGVNRKVLSEAMEVGVLEVDKGIRLFGRVNRPVYKALEYSTDPYIPGISGSPDAAKQFLTNIGVNPMADGKWRTLKDLSPEELKKLHDSIIMERIRDGHNAPEDIFGNVYTIKNFPDELQDAREMATYLNACGRMDQASIGVMACVGDMESQRRMMNIMNGYRKMIAKYMNWLKNANGNVKETENAFYICGKDQVSENFIGTITTIASKSGMFKKDKPIISYAYGDNDIKLSGRASEELVQKGINLGVLFDSIVKGLGGTGGGHHGAGGAFLPKDKESMIIEMCERHFKSLNTSS